MTAAVSAALVVAVLAALSWRLASGPISLDLATPWLVAAIQEKLGSQQRVEVGGTQIERSANGKTSLRLRDVVLRDNDGTVVASAPKVEVGLSGLSMAIGQIHAERISLVGAEVSVRIETDGKLTIFAGSSKRPIATTPAAGRTASPTPAATPAKPDQKTAGVYSNGADAFGAILAWIDSLGRTGLDGRELFEIGLKGGTLVVEDRREGTRWRFDDIDVSMNRPAAGGVRFKVQSGQAGREWSIDALARPLRGNRRSIRLEALRVPARDALLAVRFADLPIKADLPISVRLNAVIGSAGNLEALQGAIVAGAGVIGGDAPVSVKHAAINFEWNEGRRALLAPMQLVLGDNRFTLLGRADAPGNPLDPWRLHLGGGSIVLGANSRTPLVLNRIRVNARFEPAKSRLRVENVELGNAETGVALSGGIDYAGTPRLMLGLAAQRMPVETMLRLWPTFVSSHIRSWMVAHVSRATVERIDVAINAPIEALRSPDQAIPDDGISVSAALSGAVFRPVDSLPEIRDADVEIRVTGRTAKITLGHGAVTMPSGQKLTMSDAVFGIADTSLSPIMSQTRVRMRGTVAAAIELIAMEPLRATSVVPIDKAASSGQVDARVTLGIPLEKSNIATAYAIDAQLSKFAADRMIVSQRVEASSLHVTANNAGYRVEGDVKIAGATAKLDYRRQVAAEQDEIRLNGVLDDATRDRLGIDLAPALTGPVQIKLGGWVGREGKDGRYAIEADLTQARIEELFPGLVKPPGKPARAAFTLVTKPETMRLDDLVLESAGTSVRGNLTINGAGKIISANLPVFSLSHGDKASLKIERGSDGGLQAVMRGDVVDGRPLIKSLLTGVETKPAKAKSEDLDVDVKIGAIAGHHGEALRGLELTLSRRGGRVRDFTVRAQLGRNARLIGDMRPRRSGQQGLYLETGDAGALFRFTDTYSRMIGGRLMAFMDPPSTDSSPQHGTIHIDNFVVRGETALDRIVVGAASGQGSRVEFASMHVEFTRAPGQFMIRDGVLRGPIIGGTIDGTIDYRRDGVRMRGTLVPLYGLNNMFGQLPIVGLFLGGGRNEGLVGITYEVTGPVSAPVLRVNPISVVAPGFIRKFFEFPSANGQFRLPADVNRR